MSFEVEPAALRAGASQVGDATRVAEAANGYVAQHGSFSFHEAGLIGVLAPGHRNLMSDLHRMLTHLGHLGEASETALKHVAARYERADQDTAAKIDDSYPVVPRPNPARD